MNSRLSGGFVATCASTTAQGLLTLADTGYIIALLFKKKKLLSTPSNDLIRKCWLLNGRF